MDRRHLARTAAGLTLTLVCALGAAAPAGAQSFGSETLPLKSDNVTPLLTLPVGKPIGARFRDNYMYITGSEGLWIYDVTDPALPKPAGALPLPHFENEDVDIGGNILLISNDPSEGFGALYVIDISNPNVPVLKGAMINGLGDGQAEELIGIFGIPPVETPLGTGIGHTVSCVNAACTYAYMAGTSKGIQIVDLTDPVNPEPVGRFVPEIAGLATHDVQVDGNGIAWIVGAEGTAGYDVTDPVNPVLVARTDEAIKNSGQLGIPSIPDDPIFHFGDVIGGEGETPIDLIHHNSLRLGTVYKAPPVPPSQTPPPGGGTPPAGTDNTTPPNTTTPPADPGGGTPTNTGTGDGTTTNPAAPDPGAATASSEPGTVIKIESNSQSRPVAQPAPTAKQRRAAKAKALRKCRKLKGKARKRCFAKLRKNSRSKDRARAAAAGDNDGSITLEAFKQVKGKAYPAGGDSPLFGVVEEDYNRPTCKGAGSFQLWGMTDQKTSKGNAKLGLLDLYTTELEKLVNDQSGWAPVTGLCSAHYFDYRDGIVAGGWYEEGTRFLDVRDPSNIKQVGYWVPTKGETWSVVFPPTDKTGTIVYALDFARGIDVLKLDRTDLKERKAPIRQSWLRGKHGLASGKTSRTGLTKKSRYGYVCRLAVKR